MTNLDLGITPPALGRPARLRADAIQRATLIAIGRAIAEGDDARRLIDALEDLGVVSHDAREGELDSALDDVATLAALDTAHMDLRPAEVRQLFEEAARAVAPAAPVVRLPQRGGEAA